MVCKRATQVWSIVLATMLLLGLLACGTPGPTPENPKSYVEAMVEAVGGVERLYALRDVEYQYTYRSQGKEDISIERYVFDGELSWARYTKRENAALPDLEGELIQGYDGQETWATLDGKLVEDPKVLRLSDFLRKTNYYWFTMMFKLLDPGVKYAHKGVKTVSGADYDLIEISFDEGVGDVQDTYVLYINPQTRLVDQFLFTVMDFGRKDPLLMKVDYEEIEGLKLPTRREYAPANWEGDVEEGSTWAEEISENIKFNNGFSKDLFQKPAAPATTSKS